MNDNENAAEEFRAKFYIPPGATVSDIRRVPTPPRPRPNPLLGKKGKWQDLSVEWLQDWSNRADKEHVTQTLIYRIRDYILQPSDYNLKVMYQTANQTRMSLLRNRSEFANSPLYV